MTNPGALLPPAAAVPLGYALVLRAAADVGVRALAIKGPVLALLGVGDPKASVDVDVLVDPAALTILQAELERIGWHRTVADGTTPSIVPHHSVNHTHPLWPFEVDLHHWFPGVLADPSLTFEHLWARRTTIDMAHCPVLVPDEVGSVAIAALHYLRERYRSRELTVLATAVRRRWSADQIAELAQLAAETGAADTMLPFLELLGAPTTNESPALFVPLADWEMRSQTRTTEVLPWLVALGRTRWWRRPRLVWRALWLGDARFESWDRSTKESRQALRTARWQRLQRARTALPLAVTEYRRLRKRS